MAKNVIESADHGDEREPFGYFAWCEGCDSRHYVPVQALDLPDGQHQPAWEFNGDLELPTFSPSVLIYEYVGHHPRCHSFIREGVWDYLSDCSHAFAGQQRRMLRRNEWPEDTWPN